MNSRVVTQSQGTVVKIVPPAPIKRFQVFCIAGTLNLVPVTEFLWTAHLPLIPSSTSKRSEKKARCLTLPVPIPDEEKKLT